jgi:hypothetical protein
MLNFDNGILSCHESTSCPSQLGFLLFPVKDGLGFVFGLWVTSLFRMFTGIVEETGKVVSFEERASAWRLVLEAHTVTQDLQLGEVLKGSNAKYKDYALLTKLLT